MRKTPLTIQQINDSYEFTVLKRILKKEFPWIKNIYVDENSLDEYSILFLKVHIDPTLFSEIYEVPLRPLAVWSLERGTPYDSPFLSLIFVFEDKEVAKDIQSEIENTMSSIKKSAALPEELKLPRDRPWGIETYVVNS